MELKTKSGICISIRRYSPSSVLFFDKPVRTIELTPEESLQVGSSLISGVRVDSGTKEEKTSSSKVCARAKKAKTILEKKGYSVRVPPLAEEKRETIANA